jgi:pyruvate formate lyase activating enzyme
MKCAFCQNYQISQFKATSEYVSPEKLAEISRDTPENLGVAFTYNEPILSYEYILDTAPLIHNNNQKVVLVSNGNISPEPLKKLLPHIDAWNIDVKSFNEDFYTTYGGNLGAVKETVATAAQACHVEITTLIIPGENDNEEEIENLVKWLADISTEIPYHLTRFFPRYNMTDKPPTPPETLYRLEKIAKKRLKNVYIGNI